MPVFTHTGAKRHGESGLTLMEVLIAATIGVIITGLLITVWLALTGSWTVTARGSEARDLARDAVARMSREIRDMEPKAGELTAVTVAKPSKIRFSTTFNLAGNQSASLAPVFTEYEYVKAEGVLHRRRDTNNIAGIDPGDRDTIVARNLLNDDTQPMFTYTYLDANGDRITTSDPASLGNTSLDNMLIVTVRVIVDMQPGKAPLPMDLTTTVQLRNQQ